jgi:hypothetical protein
MGMGRLIVVSNAIVRSALQKRMALEANGSRSEWL